MAISFNGHGRKTLALRALGAALALCALIPAAGLLAADGVYGARMTGGGFGGCVVALCRPGALRTGWLVAPSEGAREL